MTIVTSSQNTSTAFPGLVGRLLLVFEGAIEIGLGQEIVGIKFRSAKTRFSPE